MKLATSRSKLNHIFIDDASRNGLMKLATSHSKLIHIFIDDASLHTVGIASHFISSGAPPPSQNPGSSYVVDTFITI